MIVCDMCMDDLCENLWIDAVTHRCCNCEQREGKDRCGNCDD